MRYCVSIKRKIVGNRTLRSVLGGDALGEKPRRQDRHDSRKLPHWEMRKLFSESVIYLLHDQSLPANPIF